MARYIKFGLIFLLISFCGYISYNMYLYFFDTNVPEIFISGIESGDWYSGELNVKLSGKDTYKIATASVWIDGKPFLEKAKINSAQFEKKLDILTTNLSDGSHLLTCELIDGTRKGNRTKIERAFMVDNLDLQAAFVMLQKQKILQGRCLHIKFRANKRLKQACVKTMSESFICFPEHENSTTYEAVIPVTCEQEPGEFSLTIEIEDFVGKKIELQSDFSVLSAPFKKKTLHVQAGRLKDESRFTDLTEHDLEAKMALIAKHSPKEKMWKGLFEVPLHMTAITTEFGLIRTSQERGRYAHKAIDLASAPRSVVWASNDGIVAIKDRYVHTGNTIVIDHGHGIVTLYCHLEEYADLEVGQRIKKGKPLGTMGMTGYANGYHLHWELRVNNIQVDPMEWTK